MYLSPLSVKTKHARVGSFTTCLGCHVFANENVLFHIVNTYYIDSFTTCPGCPEWSLNIEEAPLIDL